MLFTGSIGFAIIVSYLYLLLAPLQPYEYHAFKIFFYAHWKRNRHRVVVESKSVLLLDQVQSSR